MSPDLIDHVLAARHGLYAELKKTRRSSRINEAHDQRRIEDRMQKFLNMGVFDEL